MGVHLIDSSDTSLVPGEYDFNQIIINGAWDGHYTFIEPMITRDWLLTEPSLEQPLKQPRAYQKTATTRPPTPSTSTSRRRSTSSHSPA